MYQSLIYQSLSYQSLRYQSLRYQSLRYQSLRYQSLRYQSKLPVSKVPVSKGPVQSLWYQSLKALANWDTLCVLIISMPWYNWWYQLSSLHTYRGGDFLGSAIAALVTSLASPHIEYNIPHTFKRSELYADCTMNFKNSQPALWIRG
jgi:hypothetical protein